MLALHCHSHFPQCHPSVEGRLRGSASTNSTRKREGPEQCAGKGEELRWGCSADCREIFFYVHERKRICIENCLSVCRINEIWKASAQREKIMYQVTLLPTYFNFLVPNYSLDSAVAPDSVYIQHLWT